MKYFTLDELKCKCGECKSTGEEMDHLFMKSIHVLRQKCGFPFIVTSAYRCAEYNAKVSKNKKYGAHTLGKAMDIKIASTQAFILLQNIYAFPTLFNGIGINQKGASRFIHIDNVKNDNKIPRPMIWSY